MLAAGLVGVPLPLPGRADLNLDPLNRWTEPEVAIDIKPRSGPIQIQVEYRIRETDVPDFLAAMGERHRIRLRDGARQWSLLRDLEDPMVWLESYQTPTWVEYVRHNQRRTHADAENTDRIRALHQGAGPAARQPQDRAPDPLEPRRARRQGDDRPALMHPRQPEGDACSSNSNSRK